MGHALDVQVIDRDENPVAGVEVEIVIDGFFTGGSLIEYTDDHGHAEFETADDYEDYRELKIKVRGDRYGPYDTGGGAYTVQI